MADKSLAMKLLSDRCLECIIWEIFFNSSFTVSITALFRIRILSLMFIRTFFILPLILVINWIPSRNRFSKSISPIYPLSAQNFPLMLFRKEPCFNGFLSSMSAAVNMMLRISLLSLIIICNLNLKNQPIEYFPRVASPSNVFWIWILWFRHTRSGVESTKLIPIHSQQYRLDEYNQRKQDTFSQFNNAIVWYPSWK